MGRGDPTLNMKYEHLENSEEPTAALLSQEDDDSKADSVVQEEHPEVGQVLSLNVEDDVVVGRPVQARCKCGKRTKLGFAVISCVLLVFIIAGIVHHFHKRGNNGSDEKPISDKEAQSLDNVVGLMMIPPAAAEETQALKNTFNVYDSNGDSSLDEVELARLLYVFRVGFKEFAIFDNSPKDGTLTKNECSVDEISKNLVLNYQDTMVKFGVTVSGLKTQIASLSKLCNSWFSIQEKCAQLHASKPASKPASTTAISQRAFTKWNVHEFRSNHGKHSGSHGPGGESGPNHQSGHGKPPAGHNKPPAGQGKPPAGQSKPQNDQDGSAGHSGPSGHNGPPHSGGPHKRISLDEFEKLVKEARKGLESIDKTKWKQDGALVFDFKSHSFKRREKHDRGKGKSPHEHPSQGEQNEHKDGKRNHGRMVHSLNPLLIGDLQEKIRNWIDAQTSATVSPVAPTRTPVPAGQDSQHSPEMQLCGLMAFHEPQPEKQDDSED